MSYRWMHLRLRNRSRAYDITIAFSFGRELCQVRDHLFVT